MSDDILTRLRAVLHDDKSVELMNREAADLIERERDTVASLLATIADIREASGVGNTVMLSELPREIAAMRARLEELADIVAGRRPVL